MNTTERLKLQKSCIIVNSLIHRNPKKMWETLKKSSNDISVILLQEIWDVSLWGLSKIEDYELFVNMQESSKGGGVAIYYKKYHKTSLLPELKS